MPTDLSGDVGDEECKLQVGRAACDDERVTRSTSQQVLSPPPVRLVLAYPQPFPSVTHVRVGVGGACIAR
ncbi:hypothetical protein BDZ91DRAFT_746698 [Kalaharituber pfeilii]|nr:hypothetical protein BDZ91DRAFT_746698 [Kalaharituber pfeilii]